MQNSMGERMTVKELIERLTEMPKKKEIKLFDCIEEDVIPLTEVSYNEEANSVLIY